MVLSYVCCSCDTDISLWFCCSCLLLVCCITRTTDIMKVLIPVCSCHTNISSIWFHTCCSCHTSISGIWFLWICCSRDTTYPYVVLKNHKDMLYHTSNRHIRNHKDMLFTRKNHKDMLYTTYPYSFLMPVARVIQHILMVLSYACCSCDTTYPYGSFLCLLFVRYNISLWFFLMPVVREIQHILMILSYACCSCDTTYPYGSFLCMLFV